MDPELRRLESLLTKPDKNQGRDFETGFAWLLQVLGFAPIHIGVWPQAVLVASRMRLAQGPFDWPTMITASVVNPVFEEVFVCGYVITALKERFGTTTAINVSAGIRVFYHFYQGALGVLGITPMALLFGYWFVRTGRLWPLIVAHALQDLTGLVANSRG